MWRVRSNRGHSPLLIAYREGGEIRCAIISIHTFVALQEVHAPIGSRCHDYLNRDFKQKVEKQNAEERAVVPYAEERYRIKDEAIYSLT